MFSVVLIQLLAAGSCVYSIDLIQPDSMVVQPGQSLTITCQVSGYSLTDSNYATGWIRQREGKPMDWILHRWGGGRFYQNNALKNKFLYDTLTSTSSVTLTGQNLQPEDTAVYYCVRTWWYSFDYWGKGTKVTVNSGSPALPSLFSLIQCKSETAAKITVGCLAYDFFPDTLSLQWHDDNQAPISSVQYPFAEKNSRYTAVSVMQVTKSEWDSKSFRCLANNTMESKYLDVRKPSSPGSPVSDYTVTVHTPPEESISNGDSAKVMLVCTVSSTVEQDYNFQWREHEQQNVSRYAGTKFATQKTKDGYLTMNVHTTTKKKWNTPCQFFCRVWTTSNTSFQESLGVSKAIDVSIKANFAFDCTDDPIEETEDFRNLWSTTSSIFMFLFISSLFYNIIFSLAKMKRH